MFQRNESFGVRKEKLVPEAGHVSQTRMQLVRNRLVMDKLWICKGVSN